MTSSYFAVFMESGENETANAIVSSVASCEMVAGGIPARCKDTESVSSQIHAEELSGLFFRLRKDVRRHLRVDHEEIFDKARARLLIAQRVLRVGRYGREVDHRPLAVFQIQQRGSPLSDGFAFGVERRHVN